MSFDLSQLNEEQMLAVRHTEGGVLVSTGAGSGKTRVLTHRIVHLVADKGVRGYNILAVTFTNKAASEMLERLQTMTNDHTATAMTFHSLCVRILRRDCDKLGYSKNFSIYDESDKEKVIKAIVKEITEDDIYKESISAISHAKNHGMSPSKYNTEFGDYNNGKIIAKIYQAYEVALKKNNAFDFDDLLIKAYQLLRDNSDVSEYYQDKFRYIHVDEFQDTNTIQYELLKILGAKHRNIFCVGDEDQSIYKWRGAKIENIGSFANDFRCTVYKLEQNYRSGQNILTIANEIIKNNTNRFHDPKELKSNKQNKGEINFFKAYDEKDEASYVIGRILRLKSEGDYRYGDFAVLSRLNATMRPFEEKLMEYGIPYKIFGGFKFYERKEIKDLLAYLKIIANPYDNEAILRVINFPKRGIGSTAIEQFIDIVSETGGRLFERIVEAEKDISIPSKLAKKIASFGRVLSNFAEASKRMGISELAEYVVGALDLQTVYSGDTDEDKARWLNINDFLAGLADYEKRNPDATLDNYLQNVSLYSDLDEMDSNDFVNIATVHSAKGLEFKVVFVIGLEEGIFPIERRGGDSDIEEERRLMYVAVTRAMERLYLTRAGSRFMYGQRNYTNPSIFLAEADPKKNIERELPTYAKSEPIKHYNQETFSPVKKAEDNITKDISGYKVGSTVKHRKFGIGKVISISDSVGGAHAEINFEGVGTLTLALNYAPIELVE